MASTAIRSFALKLIIQENKINLNTVIYTEISNIPSWILKINIKTSMTKYPKSLTSPIIYKQKCIEIELYKNINITHSNKIYIDASKINSNKGITIICNEEMVTYKIMPQYSI